MDTDEDEGDNRDSLELWYLFCVDEQYFLRVKDCGLYSIENHDFVVFLLPIIAPIYQVYECNIYKLSLLLLSNSRASINIYMVRSCSTRSHWSNLNSIYEAYTYICIENVEFLMLYNVGSSTECPGNQLSHQVISEQV